MKIFGWDIRRVFAPERRMSPENPRHSLDDPGIMDALWMDAGSLPPVRPQRALQTSAVYACVRALAESLASLPADVFKKTETGGLEKVGELNELLLIRDAPNNYQTSFVFREHMMFYATLWGNAYAEIQRDKYTGRVLGLYPLHASEVQVSLVDDGHGGLKKIYLVKGNTLQDDDIVHIPAPGFNGITGLSPIALHRATLTMTLNSEEFGANFYKNGTRLSGVVEHPGKLSDEAARRIRSSWQETYAGKANAGKVAVLEEGMKFNPLSMPLADAQYLETRKFQVSDIARIFRVPPHMIGDLEKATFSNIEQQSIEFVRNTLLPWVVKWEQELTRKLFGMSEQTRGRFVVKFNLAVLLSGDMKSRYEAFAIGRNGGWLSANDVRIAEGMNPVEGGDEYLTPLNMNPVGKKPDKEPSDNTKENEGGNE